MLVPIHVMIQGFLALVTGSLFIFFLSMYCKGHANWMVVYVQLIELLTYVVFLAGGEGVKILVGDTNELFVWVRYAGWFTTCPVLLQMMTKVVHADTPSSDFTTQTIMAFLVTNVMGVTAAILHNPLAKWMFFTLGCFGAMKLFHGLYSAWKIEVLRMEPESLPARHQLMALMGFTWCAFPIAFVLGPEMTSIATYEACAIIYAVLDLFCKNLYGFMCWHFNYRNAWSHTGFMLGLSRESSPIHKRKAAKRNAPLALHSGAQRASGNTMSVHASPHSPNAYQSQFDLLYNAIREQGSFIREMQKAASKSKNETASGTADAAISQTRVAEVYD